MLLCIQLYTAGVHASDSQGEYRDPNGSAKSKRNRGALAVEASRNFF
jgi:hypothetical protein